ncbi:MAG: YXWGXW repeat-containing protein [Rhodoferax sp.]|nr:YXWGXW repeat-containing protein [Rhodoferax sp.]
MRSFRLLQFGSLVAVAAIAAGLAGCVVAPARPVVYAPPPPHPPPHPLPAPGSYYPNGVVMVARPPPYQEVVGYPPAPGYLWIGGFWNWVGGRHVWVAGHWEMNRPRHVWVPHQWIRFGGGWRFEPGRWHRH